MAPLKLIHVTDLGVKVVAELGKNVRIEVLPLPLLQLQEVKLGSRKVKEGQERPIQVKGIMNLPPTPSGSPPASEQSCLTPRSPPERTRCSDRPSTKWSQMVQHGQRGSKFATYLQDVGLAHLDAPDVPHQLPHRIHLGRRAQA